MQHSDLDPLRIVYLVHRGRLRFLPRLQSSWVAGLGRFGNVRSRLPIDSVEV
ncbi:hypothetical protein [Nostoc sp.]|uniref:hypothetical protein n=1 Tax=Nostoc sp. TaxID=1180 RepID=UPI002FFC2559